MSDGRTTSDTGPLVDGLFRREAAHLTARLARLLGTGRLDEAEEIVQSVLLKALHAWPHAGIPDNPAGWLWRTARNEAVDRLRRRRFNASLTPEDLADRLPDGRDPADTRLQAELADEKLGLIFACCHPVLPLEARVALTLKAVCGLGTAEIARAFLLSVPATAQRITRAKARLAQAGVAFAIPAGAELPGRLDAVLATLYLLLNEGVGATAGEAMIRPDIVSEALHLARQLADHPVTGRPEAEAMAALACLTAARLPARLSPDGMPVLLADQDRTRWHRGLIAAGLRHLKAGTAGPEETRWHLEAAIAATHAVAPRWSDTDWPLIVTLYDRLAQRCPGPVTRLNRAVALAEARGPAAGLAALEGLADDGSMARYPLYAATRAALLERLGDRAGAVMALRQALTLAERIGLNHPERRLLRARLDRLSE
ncbi:RNA polymerase sigma factor [Niveispirillum fermenti]|uniref:RNA polymerase sigma factor n=1 Tax=Niveispirillum fermenti TaxID=1233113 RepID=UPI003A87B59B